MEKIVQNHYGSGDNVKEKHEHHHEASHIIPKILTKQTGLANDIYFVGRKEELQKVDELLNQNSMLLLLNGIGGIGKSTLASYYLNQKKDEFDYYGFVQVNEDIKLSFVSAFSTSLDLKSEKIDDLFAETMNKLQNLEGKKLLIVDDIKEMNSQLDKMSTLMTLRNSGFKILFTSRETKEYIPQYFLDIMNIEDARELFLKYYPTDEMDKVDKILEYLDYHTMFIEITAKTLKQRKRTLSLDKMIEKFVNGEFSAIKKNKRESFNLFLQNLFQNDKILQDEETLLFLKRISILPSIEISFEDLYKFLVCKNKEGLEDFLIELVDNGWLIEFNEKYKFHQILKEFILKNYLPNYKEIKTIIDYFHIISKQSHIDLPLLLKSRENIVFFESLYLVLKIMNDTDDSIINMVQKIGNIYFQLEDMSNAEKCYTEAVTKDQINTEYSLARKIRLNVSLATAYRHRGKYEESIKLIRSNLMQIDQQFYKDNALIMYFVITLYHEMGANFVTCGEYSQAFQVYELLVTMHKDTITSDDSIKGIIFNDFGHLLKIMSKDSESETYLIKAIAMLSKFPHKAYDLAMAYHNLGSLYELMERYTDARNYLNNSLKRFKSIFRENHSSIAMCYASLAKIFELTSKFTRAEILYLHAIEIYTETLGVNNQFTATTYNNLAILYETIDKHEESEKLFKKSLRIREIILDKSHPDVGSSYNNLASLYCSMKEFKKSHEYMSVALKILETTLPEDHPNLVGSRNIMQYIENMLVKEAMERVTSLDYLYGKNE